MRLTRNEQVSGSNPLVGFSLGSFEDVGSFLLRLAAWTICGSRFSTYPPGTPASLALAPRPTCYSSRRNEPPSANSLGSAASVCLREPPCARRKILAQPDPAPLLAGLAALCSPARRCRDAGSLLEVRFGDPSTSRRAVHTTCSSRCTKRMVNLSRNVGLPWEDASHRESTTT